jgi:hypothetical protein
VILICKGRGTDYYTKTAGQMSNTGDELLAEFKAGRTKMGARAVALVNKPQDAAAILAALNTPKDVANG